MPHERSRAAGRTTSRALSAALVAALCLGGAGCTTTSTGEAADPSAVATGGPSGSAGRTSTPASAESSPGEAPADTLTIDVTIAHGKTTPSGRKLDARVGQKVVLNVTSDEDDEIHAHTGGNGYELEVAAGKVTTGSFTLTSPGSFEVESHHLAKVIVILNVR